MISCAATFSGRATAIGNGSHHGLDTTRAAHRHARGWAGTVAQPLDRRTRDRVASFSTRAAAVCSQPPQRSRAAVARNFSRSAA